MILIFLTFCVNNPPPSVFKKEVAAQIKPPGEFAKLESILYEFLLAADREGFARTHHIFFREGRLRLFIVIAPNTSGSEKEGLISTYQIGVEKESGNLLRATVPVEALASLAGEKLILSIRLPDRPMIQ
jgi:hypothetical protein